MTLLRKSEALVILCVLVSLVHGLEPEVKGSPLPCEVTVKEGDPQTTVNCSRRNLHAVKAEWSQEVSQIDKEAHVFITFMNNSITNITELPSVPGSRVAVNFKNNQVIEIASGAFTNLDRLFYLDLSNNNLTGDVLRSEIFQGPYNGGAYGNIALDSLYLGHNQIHSLDRYLFQYTPNLTRLYLDNNPLEILDHVTTLALSSAVNLEVLDLSYTGIDNLPFDVLRGLVKLREIDLSGNYFITVPESLTLVGQTLEYLTFNNNPIVDLNDDSFVGLSNLKELEVGENDFLEDVKRSTFSPLRSLRVLHLCHNRNLKYINHNAFRGMKDRWTINEVYLDENNLRELSTDLMPWSKLEVLGMSGNMWLCNCDLANIVTTQKAGDKFKGDKIPTCDAPMKMHGEYLTNLVEDPASCRTLDPTSNIKAKNSFSLSSLKPKHVLWSIVGVAMIVVTGMLLGLLMNTVKTFYNNKIRSQPIRYVNLNADATFA